MKNIKIEFLYFEDCPNFQPALKQLERILKEEGVGSSVEMINVTSEEMAKKFGFLGSPSIRISGKDIEGGGLGELGMKCRIYKEQGKTSNIQSDNLIRTCLRKNLE